MKLAGFAPDADTPGPGKYDKSSTLSKVSYSIRTKPKLPSLSTSPGPGACKHLSNLRLSSYND
jgi:hypothetical protein